MANPFFRFKQFTIYQQHSPMRVTTDACLFGAWVSEIINPKKESVILDIGTGTGLLSLMLAQKYPAKIIAIERDPIAFSEANENIKAAGKNQQIQLQLISVQKFVPEIDYDYIICNPPFFKQSLKSPHAEKNLSKHEDNLPLELLVKFISMHLSTKGQAGILLPAYRGEEVLELLKKYVLYPAEIAFVQQTASHTAFRIMLLVQKTETHPREMQIIIKENDGKYSDAFSQLLSDYYLYL